MPFGFDRRAGSRPIGNEAHLKHAHRHCYLADSMTARFRTDADYVPLDLAANSDVRL